MPRTPDPDPASPLLLATIGSLFMAVGAAILVNAGDSPELLVVLSTLLTSFGLFFLVTGSVLWALTLAQDSRPDARPDA